MGWCWCRCWRWRWARRGWSKCWSLNGLGRGCRRAGERATPHTGRTAKHTHTTQYRLYLAVAFSGRRTVQIEPEPPPTAGTRSGNRTVYSVDYVLCRPAKACPSHSVGRPAPPRDANSRVIPTTPSTQVLLSASAALSSQTASPTPYTPPVSRVLSPRFTAIHPRPFHAWILPSLRAGFNGRVRC